MKQTVVAIIGALLATTLLVLLWPNPEMITPSIQQPLWTIRSIDTMKYSRDLAQSKINDKSFDVVIDAQVKAIAETGATHVGIATPYDEEFMPYLRRWVDAARRHNLKVWFRGNFSGWEQWFGFEAISRSTHRDLLEKFIDRNIDLFVDGDMLTPCPECENGGPGDPRMTQDVDGFRNFLIDERRVAIKAFSAHNKKISISYQSMNLDVAKLVMNPETTEKLGGVVGIDHYVADPVQLAKDVEDIARRSGGKVFLGEFGTPIPDINGDMTEAEQAKWIETALDALSKTRTLVGLNYWVATGGSTAIWKDDGQPKIAVEVLTKYYKKLK